MQDANALYAAASQSPACEICQFEAHEGPCNWRDLIDMAEDDLHDAKRVSTPHPQTDLVRRLRYLEHAKEAIARAEAALQVKYAVGSDAR